VVIPDPCLGTGEGKTKGGRWVEEGERDNTSPLPENPGSATEQ